MLRNPAVAGQFYPGTPDQLGQMVGQLIGQRPRPGKAILAVSPHAGYVYSGATAAKVLAQVEIPRRVILAGPNHRGVGAPVALMTQGEWETPLGRVSLDGELGAAILAHAPQAREDEAAHRYEHSLEVQVPFLQYLQPDLLLTPLCLGLLRASECLTLGHGIAQAIKEIGEDVLLVASTDMTHYESSQAAEAKDELAIDRILAMDPTGLYDTVRGQGISMCGVIPTTVLLAAAKELGATQAELVEYTNSGVVSGDFQQVVGYAGLVVS